MTNLIALTEIKNTPASIEFDYDGIKAVVQSHLEKYKGIVLTAETYKDGKELIKEINATRKSLDAARKDEVKKAIAPIKEFEEKIKDLLGLHDSLLDNLRGQIKKYDDNLKLVIEDLIKQELEAETEKQGVRPEYKRAEADDLILLGSLTEGGKLTAKVKAEIKNRVTSDLLRQHKEDMRVAQLKTECIEAGLKSPLTRSFIESFLGVEDDAVYNERLQNLINAELQREQEAIEQERIRLERIRQAEAQAKAKHEAQRAALEAQAQAKAEAQAAQLVHQPQEQPQPEPQAQYSATQEATEGKCKVSILVSFDLEINSKAPDHILAQKLDEKLKAGGFNSHTIQSIKRG